MKVVASIISITVPKILPYFFGSKSLRMQYPTGNFMELARPSKKNIVIATYAYFRSGMFLFSYLLSGSSKLTPVVIPITVKAPIKYHFRPLRSEKLGRNIDPKPKPKK